MMIHRPEPWHLHTAAGPLPKVLYLRAGGMAERSNAAVLKTVVPKGTGGSNPSSSAAAGAELLSEWQSCASLESPESVAHGVFLLQFVPLIPTFCQTNSLPGERSRYLLLG